VREVIQQPDDIARATDTVRAHGRATVSILRRRLKIEYLQAHHLLDQLEKSGVITLDDEHGQRRVI